MLLIQRQRSKEWSLPGHITALPAQNTCQTICSSVGPVFAFADTQILRERYRPFCQLVLRLNINQPGPEALYQFISKRGHLPGTDSLDTNSSRAQQQFRLDNPVRIFTLEVYVGQ